MKLVKEITQETSDKIRELFYKKEAISKIINTIGESGNKDAMNCTINIMVDTQTALDIEMDNMEKDILKDKYKKFDYSYRMDFLNHTVEFETENTIWTCLTADYGFRKAE